MTRKEKADYFLYNCELLDELNKYGKPHLIGSYRMDMMAWNDVDIDVENQDMSLDKLYRLSAFITEKFKPTWYEAKEEISGDGKKVWFFGFETMITGELWNFDIWFFDRETIYDALKYCDNIVANSTDKQKSIIVQIKNSLIEKGLYSFDNYTSIDVYKAVTEMNISSIDEFLAKYTKN